MVEQLATVIDSEDTESLPILEKLLLKISLAHKKKADNKSHEGETTISRNVYLQVMKL